MSTIIRLDTRNKRRSRSRLLPENGQVIFTKTRKIEEGRVFNDIMDVWLFEYGGEISLENATTYEVEYMALMSADHIK